MGTTKDSCRYMKALLTPCLGPITVEGIDLTNLAKNEGMDSYSCSKNSPHKSYIILYCRGNRPKEDATIILQTCLPAHRDYNKTVNKSLHLDLSCIFWGDTMVPIIE